MKSYSNEKTIGRNTRAATIKSSSWWSKFDTIRVQVQLYRKYYRKRFFVLVRSLDRDSPARLRSAILARFSRVTSPRWINSGEFLRITETLSSPLKVVVDVVLIGRIPVERNSAKSFVRPNAATFPSRIANEVASKLG